MRSICFTIAAFLMAFSAASAEDSIEDTYLVEHSLRAPVLFAGDQKWDVFERMVHYGVPGLSIAVIENGKVAWAKAYGVKDRDTSEEVITETLFQAGSISKPVAALAALQMVEDGTLQLDQPVNSQIKSWQIPENELTKAQPVLLSHLINHTAGLTVHGFRGYAVDEEVPGLLQVLEGRKPANNDPIVVDMLPGEQFRYSGGGYSVLQQVMIDSDQETFPELMEDRVLKPIGMTNSTYQQPLPHEQLKMAASGYLPDNGAVPGDHHIYPEMAAAGLWTTASDLAKFVGIVQLSARGENHDVISQAMATKMMTATIEDGVGFGFFFPDTPEGNRGYFEHEGWDEGFSAKIIGHKTKGYGVVVMINSNHPQFMAELVYSVADVYGWDDYLLPIMRPLQYDIEEINHIVGAYNYDDELVLGVFSEDGKVYMEYVDFDRPKARLFKIGENEYIRRERTNKIMFIDDANGEANFAFVNSDGTLQELERIDTQHLD